jgi:hypothetical protein
MITDSEFIEIIETVIKNGRVINDCTWKYLSETMDIKILEKYINNFNIKALCKNKTITIDFIKKYLHLFERDYIISQLSNKIKIDYSDIKQDPHVTLSNTKTYKNIEYSDFEFNYKDILLMCDKQEYQLCEFYKKWFREYNPKNNYYSCNSCGDLESCYEMIHNLYNMSLFNGKSYSLINFKKENNLHLVESKYIKLAIDILINDEYILSKSRFLGEDNFIKLLSKNKGISFKDKYESKDLIDWNWDYIVSNSTEYSLVKNLLKNTEDNEHYLYDFNDLFLDGIIDKNINDKFFYDKLLNLDKNNKNILKNYKKIDLLLETLIEKKTNDNYYINDLIEYVSLDCIIKNKDFDWEWDTILKRKDITFDFIKECYNKKVKLNWYIIVNKSFITKDLILSNPTFPWPLQSLKSKYVDEW